MKEESRRFLNQINIIFIYVSTSIEKEGAPPFIVSENISGLLERVLQSSMQNRAFIHKTLCLRPQHKSLFSIYPRQKAIQMVKDSNKLLSETFCHFGVIFTIIRPDSERPKSSHKRYLQDAVPIIITEDKQHRRGFEITIRGCDKCCGDALITAL